MKQLFKSFFITAALVALVGFIGCSKDNNKGGDPVDGKETYTRITVTQSAAATRAPGGSELPTTDEKNVKTATLYIFKHPAMTLDKVVALEVTGGVADSKVFKMATGQHSFYTVINAPAVFTTPIGMLLSTFKAVLQDVAAISAITDNSPTGKGFFITTIDTPAVENIVEATEAQANAGTNNFTFRVGRAMAKVNVKFDPTSQSLGVLDDVEYKVHAQPNKMFLMPNYVGSPVVFKTPYHDAPTFVAGNYFNSATYLAEGGANASYMMENSNEAPLQGNATFLMIKGEFTPTLVYDQDGLTSRPGTAGATFYRIFNKTDKTYTAKMYHTSPTQAEMNSETGTVNPGNEHIVAVEYTAGASYYGMWISQTSQGTVNTAYDIKRNSYYYVVITSVSGPGSHSEGSVVDPTDPIITDTHIKATIEHMDWTVIDQEGGI